MHITTRTPRHLLWWLQDWARPSTRRRRLRKLRWWLPIDLGSWRQDGWRWRVATAANRIPGSCWTDQVTWALRHHEDDHDTWLRDLLRRLPWSRRGTYCAEDRDRTGSCYCGQLRSRALQAQLDQQRADERAAR